MQWGVMVAGLVAEIVGWWFVSARGRNVWRLMPIVLGTMGVAAVLAQPPVAAAEVTMIAALAIGLASGLALFLGTRVFVWAAAHWEPFRRDVVEKYSEAAEVSLRRSLLLSLVIMVPSEELFWRGLFQGRLAVAMARGGGRGDRVDRIRAWPTSRAARCRSWRARWWAGRCGPGSPGGRAACWRVSRAISCGRG